MHAVAAPAAQLPVPTNRVYVRPQKLSSPRAVLVGFCESSRNAAPYDDKDCTFFGLNKAYIFQPTLHYYFETHSPEIYNWEIRRPNGHKTWLKSFKGPIFQHVADPEIPNSIAYPLQEVADFIGVNIWRLVEIGKPLVSATKDPYLTSSIAYQIALAMYEGFETIELYGIDLNTGGEYAWQKAGVEYLLGMAAGRGHKVILPGNCPLLHGDLYGRGFLKPEGESITVTQLEVRMKELQQKLEKMSAEWQRCSGCLMEARYTMSQMPPGIDAETQDKRVKELAQMESQLKAQCLQIQGSLQEVMYMISTTPQGQPGDQAIAQIESGQVTAGAAGGGNFALNAAGVLAQTDEVPPVESGGNFETNGHEQTIEPQLVIVAGG